MKQIIACGMLALSVNASAFEVYTAKAGSLQIIEVGTSRNYNNDRIVTWLTKAVADREVTLLESFTLTSMCSAPNYLTIWSKEINTPGASHPSRIFASGSNGFNMAKEACATMGYGSY